MTTWLSPILFPSPKLRALAPGGRTLSAQVTARAGDGTLLRFTGRESAAELARELRHLATASGSYPPLRLDIVAFSQGWNRKRLTVTDRAVRSIAHSGVDGGWATWYGHNLDDRDCEEGVGHTSWVAGSSGAHELCARVTLHHQRALGSIARGIRQRWSMAWEPTELTTVICSSCGADANRDPCLCGIMGAPMTLDGEPDLVEITRFPRVAATKTRIMSAQLDAADPFCAPLRASFRTRILDRGHKMGAQFANLVNDRISELTASGETTADAVVESLAVAVGVDVEALRGVLDGTDNCPVPPVRDGIVAAMAIDPAAASSALAADGCPADEVDVGPEPEVDEVTAAELTANRGRVTIARQELDAVFARLDGIEAHNSLLQAQLALTQKSQRETDAAAVIKGLVADWKIRKDAQREAIALRAQNPSHFDAVVALFPNVGALAANDLTTVLTGGAISDPAAHDLAAGAETIMDEVKRLEAAGSTKPRSRLFVEISKRRAKEAEALGVLKMRAPPKDAPAELDGN